MSHWKTIFGDMVEKKTKNWTSKGENTISHSYPHNTALFVFHQNLEYNIVFQHN